ncbi:hypothetical protein CKAN_02741400 [Cinnamomum micranthum f. kanehirae]|uniref:Uncharacterized protein n=1 Tax=Cinnamomum micranthum f. kanehirae TaxID=337451 RepID=A0A3S3N8N3_9MAGN|nr:hypothetical protein CKAN_02741400 [Cinnamomum micranthum f. kanehirae]
MARWAKGAIPTAVPLAFPSTLAPSTNAPAAVLAVCVPCPLSSDGEAGMLLPSMALAPSTKDLAPMIFLLQALNSHFPFHFGGGEGIPTSLNDGWLGIAPLSKTPMITPLPKLEFFQTPMSCFNPRKSGVVFFNYFFIIIGLISDKPPMQSPVRRRGSNPRGDQSGCELLSSAAIPLRWGHDMDVPDIMLKVEPKIGNDPTFRGHPARTLTPGPMMSGFRIPGLGKLGPRDENDITIGDGDVPKIVPLKRIIAVGERVEFI